VWRRERWWRWTPALAWPPKQRQGRTSPNSCPTQRHAGHEPDKQALPLQSPLGDGPEIDQRRSGLRFADQFADQLDGLELRIGHVEARRMAEEIEHGPML